MQQVAPNSKLFGGRRYYFYEGYHKKADAQAEAKRRRKLGYKVRVVGLPNIKGHFLYERGLRTKGLKR